MRIRDLMQQDVVTLKAGETLDLAEDIMKLGRIRHLPVIEGDRLVGILSQRDLFRAAASSLLGLRRTDQHHWLAGIPVTAVMTAPVVTAEPNMVIREAAAIMLSRRIGCLPVVEDGRMIGILSETDCLRCLAAVLGIAETRGALPEVSS